MRAAVRAAVRAAGGGVWAAVRAAWAAAGRGRRYGGGRVGAAPEWEPHPGPIREGTDARQADVDGTGFPHVGPFGAW